jgi:vacuolar-type H+-ATPase subunit E/Vma4
MQSHGSVASVVAAIRDEAAAEVERLQRASQTEVEKLRATTEAFQVPDREQRLAAARREQRERVAQNEWECRRAVIEQREEWIRRVIERGNEMLASGDRSAALNRLFDEARRRLPEGPCRAVVAERDVKLLQRKDVEVKAGPISGGCIVSAASVTFDNSFEARARRLEFEWRKAIAALYVAGGAPS